ncbi:MAG TPA: S41 family peptidase [Ignavibacteriaceae bacterium]|nr:S41 family peptidase [Ignavibacteriaceae bacterium]
MRKVIILLFLTSYYSNSFGQFPGSVDSLYTFIKYNSVLRSTVDWKQIDKTFKEQIESSKSLKDTMNCFVAVLEELNDVHSQIFLNNEYYGHYPSFEDSILVWLKPLNDKAISMTNKIHSEIIEDKIGYIRVPSIQIYDPTQINNYAQSLTDIVIELSKKCKKGFIIDLRLNGGGNLYPMISGLSQFLGNQTIGYETEENDSITRTWELKNGNFVIGGYQATDIKIKQKINLKSIPIVIIIGPVTKSSGSMTAIAFKGRPNTIFIGEPTADGYTTSNGYFQFAPNLTLNFATHYVADRNKSIYKTTVNPDILISQGDNFDDLMVDKKIIYAIKWLTDK